MSSVKLPMNEEVAFTPVPVVMENIGEPAVLVDVAILQEPARLSAMVVVARERKLRVTKEAEEEAKVMRLEFRFVLPDTESVDDACSPDRNQIGVEVELANAPKLVVGLHANAPPPAPVSSTPSQRPAAPVMVVQKLLQVVPVTPLKVRAFEMVRSVDEARPRTERLPYIVEVAMVEVVELPTLN